MSSNIVQIIRLIASTSFHQFIRPFLFKINTCHAAVRGVPAMTRMYRMYPHVIIVYAEISRANYNRTSARKFHSFFLSLSLPSLDPCHLFLAPRPTLFLVAPVLLLAASQPRYSVGLPLTNNIKRPDPLRCIMPRYNSRTSGHRKGGPRERRDASAGWNLVERVSRPTRRIGAREAEEEASSRENHFELRSGEAISSPTYGISVVDHSLCCAMSSYVLYGGLPAVD